MDNYRGEFVSVHFILAQSNYSDFVLFSFLLIVLCHLQASPPISKVHIMNYPFAVFDTVQFL
jgi:hypothetical protein